MPWSVDVGVAVDLRSGRSRARSGPPRSPRARELVGARRRSRRARSGGSPTCRRSSRPRSPAGRGCSAPSAPGVKAIPCSYWTAMPSANEMWPMCSTPPPIATSWTPEAISAAAKLIACWAEPHWRSTVVAGRLDRQAGLEPGVAADVERLLAELLHAAGDDVLDLRRVDPGALDQLGVGLGEQVRGVDVLVVALLLVAAADGRAHRLDDHDLAAAELARAVARHQVPFVRSGRRRDAPGGRGGLYPIR